MNFVELLLRLSSVSVVTSIVMLVTSMILGRIMEPAHFGEYSFFQSILMILLNIAAMGGSLCLSVFLYRGSSSKLSRILNNILFSILPVFMTIGMSCLLIYSIFVSDFSNTSFLVLANVGIMSICLIAIEYLRVKQIIKSYIFLFLGYTISISLSSVIGYILGHEVFYLYLMNFIVVCIPTYFSLKIFSRDFSLNFNYGKKLKTYIWSVKYGIPIVSSTAVMSFLVIGDKIILAGLVSRSVLAEYSIAALIASTSLFLVNNFASAWGAHLFKLLPSLSVEELSRYYFSSIRLLFLTIPIILVVYLCQLALYIVFFSDKYPGLSITIFTLTAAYGFLGVSKYFMGYLNYFSRNIFILYSSSIACIALILLSVFTFGSTSSGMALSVLLSMIILFLIIVYLTTNEVRAHVHS